MLKSTIFKKAQFYFLITFFSLSNSFAEPPFGDPLIGTHTLTESYDFSYAYVTQLVDYVQHYINETQPGRTNLWDWNYGNFENYKVSIAPHLTNLSAMLGIVPAQTEIVSNSWQIIGTGIYHSVESFSIFVSTGVTVRGLAVFPNTTNSVSAVVIPSAAPFTPEILLGIDTNYPSEVRIGQKLAEKGLAVICPLIINHEKYWSGHPSVRTNILDHRRWLFQQGYHIGKPLIGVETAELVACVKALLNDSRVLSNSIGIIGRELDAGVAAFYAGALEDKIQAVFLSGYFNQRTNVWRQSIDHHQWGVLKEFGDAEVASLVAPRSLIIESPFNFPNVPINIVSSEYIRAKIHYDKLGITNKINYFTPIGGTNIFGCEDSINSFLKALNAPTGNFQDSFLVLTSSYSSISQMRDSFYEIQNWYQNLCSNSYSVRQSYFWDKIDRTSISNYEISVEPFRSNLIYEMFGPFPEPDIPLQVWTSVYKSNDSFTTYRILMTLYTNVNSYGLLCVPNNIGVGEKRPCVVCQHGLEGTPEHVADYANTNVYHFFAARLAEEGFVTYAPQNPIKYNKTFIDIQRRAGTVKKDLMGLILRQHQRGLDFLSSLPFVNSENIGIYGLSWGGRTASWIGAAEPRYSVSVSGGNFSDAVQKYTSLLHNSSYLYVSQSWRCEDDLWKFNRLNKFSHAELAAMIAPRPFMVECGLDDNVSVAKWASNEYIKVRQLYDDLGIPNKTQIEFFDGGHEINGVESFEFLKTNLGLPEPNFTIVFISFITFFYYNLFCISKRDVLILIKKASITGKHKRNSRSRCKKISSRNSSNSSRGYGCGS